MELSNDQNSAIAKIYLNEGASLQELSLNNLTLIENLEPLAYSDVYASSLLFPFANRIRDGLYKFQGKTYQFPINESGNNNALHGLVFNKTFTVSNITESENSVIAVLEYTESNPPESFPFQYKIELKYTLTTTELSLKVSIKNLSDKTFPFTLGWHPYFITENLNASSLHFKSSKKMVFNERMITKGTKPVDQDGHFSLKEKQLDDCWELDATEVLFKTPGYTLLINSSEANSYLQAYTPPRKNTIAIEPTTGVSDSFNNKIGLKELHPKDTYSLTWRLQLNKNEAL
ncbi:aldose 1-epimerase [Gaetbulibacter aestuarii]|uniref:Aldose 1-epimerase n=1 Tax=Gaetbulibacter aestuarii TaxID=1502358 RepID=A0ABW7N1F5_9FLAO